MKVGTKFLFIAVLLLHKNFFNGTALKEIVRCKDDRIVKGFEALLYLTHDFGVRNAKLFNKELLGHSNSGPCNGDGNRNNHHNRNKKHNDKQTIMPKTFGN